MTVPVPTERRFELLDMLPDGWVDIMDRGDYTPSDDIVDVYAGTDNQAIKALKKYGLMTPETEKWWRDQSIL